MGVSIEGDTAFGQGSGKELPALAQNAVHQLGPGGVVGPRIDYRNPPGAAALYAPDSIAWRVYKNPLTLLIGGITAVLLELAEPRVRSGVWDHSIFRTDPLARIRRTGLSTLATIYAPADQAERMIRNVGRMHSRVSGTTADGVPYRADDVALLDWVQATVDFGFMEAYATYGGPLTDQERDAFYAESIVSARLFGAVSKPTSLEEQKALMAAMLPRMEPHPIIGEFLQIITTVKKLPTGLGWLQRMCVRAGISNLPPEVNAILGLGPRWQIKGWERGLLKVLGWSLDHLPLSSLPPVQACRRVGVDPRVLYGGRRR